MEEMVRQTDQIINFTREINRRMSESGVAGVEGLVGLYDQLRTALAKGVRWPIAVRRHALPNAAIPLVTIIGFFVGSLIAGGVVTENVFAWPGIGRLLVSSVQNRDSAVVQVIVVMIALSMVTVNFAVDIAYGWLDPRIRQLRTEA